MKKLLKILTGFVVVLVLAVVAAFYFTSGMVNTATAFFEAVKEQDIAAARSYLSEDFKASTDEATLEQFLSTSALLRYKEAGWSNRQVSGGRGELHGAVTTDTGGIVPLRLTFVKENGEWKIYGIQKPTAGLQVGTGTPGIPGKAEQVALVRRSMRDFAISVNAESMEHFHSAASRLWQRQVTAAKLDEIFAITYNAGLDFTVLDDVEPTIEPVSALGENGELILKGNFPTTPVQLEFEQTYVYEGIGWKLLGFAIDFK